jgi:nicotinamide mononucleotide transporter
VADDVLPVSVWPLWRHVVALAILLPIAMLNGYLLANRTDAALPYIDALTTWGALWATFLVARKVLENWWYWLAIDVVSIVVYWSRDLELTALLFVVYVAMIPFGLMSWRRSMSPAVA